MNDVRTDVVLSMTVLRPEERLLVEALCGQGLSVETALPGDFGEILARKNRPGVAVVRNLSHKEALANAKMLEHSGIRTLNRASSIDTCGDKGYQALLFARHGVPHPGSRLAFSFDQVQEAVESYGFPVVVKPVSGSWGRGVTRMTGPDCLDAWIGGRESTDAAGKFFPVLVQQYVDKPDHDLRVVVVGGTPVAAFRRVSDSWRTNTTLGAKVEPVEATPEMEALCQQVVEVVGEGFYGIDLVEDRAEGVLKVLEVNANPEFAKSSKIHGVDVAGLLAEYVSKLVDNPDRDNEPVSLGGVNP
ncbi:RimK family alpha-L-glutamate ligase [Salininema proteolyticum]|uniref:RimK family alpha-L-glutamate ligase n=1 Tax=Salininema proteolyticum TaxID=1607685 RepID=A0ABV8TTP8_9ACTN